MLRRSAQSVAVVLFASLLGAAACPPHAAAAAEGGGKPDAAKAAPATPELAHASLRDVKGDEVGTARFRQTPFGVMLIVRFSGLPEGTHAFHIHETGKCEPPFASAGGHLNPLGAHHGFENREGFHLGDMPNITVPQDAALEVAYFLPGVTITAGKTSLFDADGSALVVHEGADDYASDPAGNAGARIACGVIERGAQAGAAPDHGG